MAYVSTEAYIETSMQLYLIFPVSQATLDLRQYWSPFL